MTTMSAGELFCNSTDPNYYAYYLGTGDPSTDGQSVHCASELPLWHVGQAVILLAYMCGFINVAYTAKRYSHVHSMRALLCLGSTLLLVWAAVQGQAPDQAMYYGIFLAINLIHLIAVLWSEKTIQLAPHLETLWGEVFSERGYNLEMVDFYNLCQEKSHIKRYIPGMKYIQENDKPHQLSILLTGKMEVYKTDSFQRQDVYLSHVSTSKEREAQRFHDYAEAFCGTVYPHEFIDSYEWLVSQGEKGDGKPESFTSQVEIRVPEHIKECVVLTWDNEKLEAVFKEHPRLRTCIHALVGKDIAEKMLRISGHAPQKTNPESNMVRNAASSWNSYYRADVLLFGKRRDEPHLIDTYEMSEVAANVFDQSIAQHNAQHGAYTWHPGMITEQGDVPEEGCCHVLWDEGFGKEYTDRIERNVPLKKLRLIDDREHDVEGVKEIYTKFDTEGVPTESIKAGVTKEIDSDTHLALKTQMNVNDGAGHERLNHNQAGGGLEVAAGVAGTKVTRIIVDIFNLTPKQKEIKSKLGAGPWCELPDDTLSKPPWWIKTETSDGKVPSKADTTAWPETQFAMLSLQKARLRIANSRLLGVSPSAIESLRPNSDSSQQHSLHGELSRFFHENCEGLEKRNLAEILKWGKWRTYHLPETVIVKQGEEGVYVGVVLQGKLVQHTEDGVSGSSSELGVINKFELIGSEDLSSKFRTARRTIKMPSFDDKEEYRNASQGDDYDGELPPHVLKVNPRTGIPTDPKHPHGKPIPNTAPVEWEYAPWSGPEGAGMYEMMYADKTIEDGSPDGKDLSKLRYVEDFIEEADTAQLISKADIEYIKEQQTKAAAQGEGSKIRITTIPTVVFAWDIKDLKRLMLADPKVEAPLSKLLGADIKVKYTSANPEALGTRMCSIPTTAREDEDPKLLDGCMPAAQY